MAQKIEIIASAVGFDKVVKGADNVTKALASTAKETQKLDSKLATFSKGSNQATASLINLGRVAQDAPFGFIGIANNINPLLESFQRLKAESGSTGTALKTLGASLLGAGGLGLAVSVITSALTFFSLSNRGASDSVKETKKSTDEAAEAVNRYNRAVESASGTIISQQQKLTDLNRTLKDTGNTYNELTKNIVNQALAQFFATQKEGVVQKLIEARIKEAQDALKKSSPFLNVQEFSPDLISKDKLKRAQAELKSQLVIINNTIRELGLEDIFGKIFEPAKGVSNVKKVKDEVDSLKKSVLDVNRVITQDFLDTFYGDKTGGVKRENIQPIGVVLEITDIKEINEAVLQQKLLPLRNQLNDILANTFGNAINGLAESLGEILSGADLSFGDVFKKILNTLASGLSQIGKALVQFGIAKEILKRLSKLNPATAIAVGVGLQIFAAALKNSFKIPGFATGTTNAPGGLALVGERGPELISVPRGSQITPNAQSMNMLGGLQAIEVYGMVSGENIYFSNRRAGQRLSRNS